jgi:hypothetical protein
MRGSVLLVRARVSPRALSLWRVWLRVICVGTRDATGGCVWLHELLRGVGVSTRRDREGSVRVRIRARNRCRRQAVEARCEC